jgi:hypothetical protein
MTDWITTPIDARILRGALEWNAPRAACSRLHLRASPARCAEGHARRPGAAPRRAVAADRSGAAGTARREPLSINQHVAATEAAASKR